MTNKIVLDGKKYIPSEMSEKAKNIVQQLNQLEEKMKDRQSMFAVLNRAKNAYISDLKSEILSTKSGFNFSEDF